MVQDEKRRRAREFARMAYEDLYDAAMQEVEVRHVGVGARRRRLIVPWPEHVLVAIAEPQVHQVRAVPYRHDGLEITIQLFVAIALGKDRIAVGERHRAALR